MEVSADSAPEILEAGDIEARVSTGMALAGGRVLTLSVREFDLLVALMRQAGAIVRREDLYGQAWGGALRRGDRSIDVYVHKLRVKLEEALPGFAFIHTHVGFGYRLDQTAIPATAETSTSGSATLSPGSHPLHKTNTSG
jgi:DNA-binding response OmpR family regulator